VADYKASLESLRDELEARNQRTHKHIHERDERVSANFSDQSQEMENQELVLNLDAEGKAELKLIADALTRLEQGTFGHCETCGESISVERLEAVPYTPYCIACAEKEG